MQWAMFLPLPQGFPSSPGYLLLAWRVREAGAKGSGQCAEPWIFLKAHLKRILKMKAYNFRCFWVSKEVTHGNGLKPQPGFVHGFTVVSIYCVQGETKNKKHIAGVVTLWFRHSMTRPGTVSSPSVLPIMHWTMLLMESVASDSSTSFGQWECISLTDVILFIWVDPQKEQVWTRNS